MSPYRMGKLEKAIRMSLEFAEAFNRQDAAGMVELISEDCILERPDPAPEGTAYSGKQAISEFWHDFFKASPQAHIDIEEIFSWGNRCIMRWRYQGEGDAGKKEHIRGVDVFKVEEGLISEILTYVKG